MKTVIDNSEMPPKLQVNNVLVNNASQSFLLTSRPTKFLYHAALWNMTCPPILGPIVISASFPAPLWSFCDLQYFCLLTTREAASYNFGRVLCLLVCQAITFKNLN